MLKIKYNTFDQFVIAKNSMENHQQQTIKKIISDRSGEFMNRKFEELLATCGFNHVFSPTYTPQHNGFAEHANWTILNKAKCLLNESKVAKAINTSTLLTNLTPTSSRQNLSPYALWTGKSPFIKKLRVFGCQAVTLVPKNLMDWKLNEVQSPSLEPQAEVDESRVSDAPIEDRSNEGAVDEALSDWSQAPDIDRSNISPFSRQPEALLSTVCNTPRTFKKATSSPNHEVWLGVISRELKSMDNLKVWDVVDFDPSYKLVGTMWVFKIKKNHLNKVVNHKARLCAQGFTQTFGINVKSAFLNAPLSETVFLSVPQGVDLDRRKSAPSPTWLYVYVDDIAIFGKEVSSFKLELSSEFDIKYLGKAELIMGIRIAQSDGCITLDQQNFAEALLELYSMGDCRPVSTPLVPNQHLSPATDKEKSLFAALGVSYRSAIGSINYISTATCRDLLHAVSSLSQFLERPGINHWKAFLHVLWYLKGTQDLALTYRPESQHSIMAYRDTDWGNFTNTRQSFTGYLIWFNDCLVIWKTKKQPKFIPFNLRSRVQIPL
ncbi:hypothetical protein O181_101284 [Austropuccinia psidii MF-1]|uniref:Integrase catalytic domain-containing protein n=1 Tax=Austropuccinia psidii MF-1 TaxID=1389203 RepID=A0A9Q3JG99_9BASI|nr:hypothetical protein [Austropuccinia psidii MF-1]